MFFQSLEKLGKRLSNVWKIALAAYLLMAHTVPAETHYVWTNSPTPASPFTNWDTAAHDIQAALDVATNGSTVLVTDGTYRVSTQLSITQQITLRGANVYPMPIIHAESNRCLYVGAPATIQGLKFTNGYVNTAPKFGAGVYAVSTGVTVQNCGFFRNSAGTSGQGGGLWLGTSGHMESCTFLQNSAGDGGALYAAGVVYLDSGYFIDNVAETNGAGIYANNTNAAIRFGVFQRNAAKVNGGAIYTRGSVSACTVVSNTAGNYGGGICSQSSGIFIDGCRLEGNTCSNDGGAVWISVGHVRNSVVYRNMAQDEGGGLRLSSSLLENSTVVSNSAPKGGGYYSSFSTSLNSIIYFNSPMDYSNRNASSVYTFTCAQPLPSGTGNTNADPLFLSLAGCNFRLSTNSPCRDTGADQPWMAASTDLDDQPRLVGTVDLGAYELGSLIVDIEAAPSVGVAPLPSVLHGLVSGTNTSDVYFEWHFTNWTTIDASGLWMTTVTNVYAQGSHSVRLVVTNASGERAEHTRTNLIMAFPGVSADFVGNPRTGAVPLIVQFTDVSSNSPQYWAWDFDHDGFVDSTEQHPQWTFNSTGLFTVALTVSNDFGNGNTSSDTIVRTNYVEAPVYHLVADFSVDKTSARTYEDIAFADRSSNGPAYWTWFFRNVGAGDSFDQNPTSQYTSAGYKTVKLIVSNEWSSAVAIKTNFIRITGYTPIHYVAPGGGNTIPYTNWNTASHSIAAAMDEAETFDTIYVSNGTYGVPMLGLLFTDGITLMAVNGPSNTIITGGGSESVIAANFYNIEPTLIDGFTINNGYAGGDAGGAWLTRNVTLQNSIITGCAAGDDGGGIYMSGGVVSNCLVIANAAGGGGGGIYVRDGGTVTHCRVIGNASTNGGGGIYVYSTNPAIASLLQSCTVVSNSTGKVTENGGGIYAWRCLVRNCLIVTNQAYRGGGLYSAFSDVINCTIAGNDATHGGGLSIESVSTARNCIVWGNTRSNLYQVSGVVLDYCDVSPATTGNGNLNADPLFADTSTGNWNLAISSPCVDSGTNLLACDMGGVPRPLDGNFDGTNVCDIGAFEFIHPEADSDGDHQRDIDEWPAGTDPLDGASFLGIFSLVRGAGADMVLRWSSVSGKVYRIENVTCPGTTHVWEKAVGAITSTPPQNVYTGSTEILGSQMYRIGLE